MADANPGACYYLFINQKRIIDLFVKKDQNPDNVKSGINAILFWGGFSVMLVNFAMAI